MKTCRIIKCIGGYRIQEKVGNGLYIVWPGLFETTNSAWLEVKKIRTIERSRGIK